MALTQDRCICVSKVEYSETSQILTLFAREHGLVRVIAKGAHRRTKAGATKFGGGVDLMDVGNAVFTDRTDQALATLTEWTLLEGHPELRNSLRGLYLGFYAAELVHYLIEEHDPHPELFDALETTLNLLAGKEVEQTFLAFELTLLRETGYLPSFSVCASCGTTLGSSEPAYFASTQGGIVCRNCEGNFPDRQAMDRRLLDLLQYMSQNGVRLPKLTRHQTDPINRLLAGHIQHTLAKALRMGPYVL